MWASLLTILGYVGPFLVVLTPLVFFHELGHYLAARFFGVKIDVFSIGFGPEIFGWTDSAQTRWKISAIPLGGYVKMYGDENAASQPKSDKVQGLSAKEREKTMWAKKPFEKIIISVAGPLANYVLAILLFSVVLLVQGAGMLPLQVKKPLPGSLAENAGFQAGDTITHVGDKHVKDFAGVVWLLEKQDAPQVAMRVIRDNQSVVLHLEKPLSSDQGIGLVPGDPLYRPVGLFSAIGLATAKVWNLSVQILNHLGRMLRGLVKSDSMGGVLMIAKLSGDISVKGLMAFILFSAVLSVNLGLMNLLPVPMLDGGHILLYLAEMVWGKSLSNQLVEWFYRLGFVLLLMVFVWTTWNDLHRLHVVAFFKRLLV